MKSLPTPINRTNGGNIGYSTDVEFFALVHASSIFGGDIIKLTNEIS